GEEVRVERLSEGVEHTVRADVRQGVRDEARRVARRRKRVVFALTRSRTDEVQTDRFRAVVVVPPREARASEHLAALDRSFADSKLRLPEAVLARDVRRARSVEAVGAKVLAAAVPACATELVTIRVLADANLLMTELVSRIVSRRRGHRATAR